MQRMPAVIIGTAMRSVKSELEVGLGTRGVVGGSPLLRLDVSNLTHRHCSSLCAGGEPSNDARQWLKRFT